MPAPALPPLTEWETFYVIIGSSAAALTGLMFVVIALNAEARRETGPAALSVRRPNAQYSWLAAPKPLMRV